jgi:FecR-like protein
MRLSRSSGIAGLVMLLICLAAGQGTEPQPTVLAVGSAAIDEVKGEVTIHSAQGGVVAAQRGAVVEAESTIETGKGSVVLHLQDGSQALVKAHSRVVVKAPEQSAGKYLELLIGKLLATVKKRVGSSPSFRMGTPTAVITVRGTRFEVHVNEKGKTFVEVYEGIVEVIGMSVPGRPVLIRPGFWTQVDPNHDPSRPQSRGGELQNDSKGYPEGEHPDQSGPGTERESSPQTRQPSTEPTETEPH